MALEVPVPEAIAVPCEASCDMLQMIMAESISVACSVKANGIGVPFFDMVTLEELPSVITGGSLIGVMVTLTVMKSVREPSEICTTKLSVPL